MADAVSQTNLLNSSGNSNLYSLHPGLLPGTVTIETLGLFATLSFIFISIRNAELIYTIIWFIIKKGDLPGLAKKSLYFWTILIISL